MEFLFYCGLAIVGVLTLGIVSVVASMVFLGIRDAWRKR